LEATVNLVLRLEAQPPGRFVLRHSTDKGGGVLWGERTLPPFQFHSQLTSGNGIDRTKLMGLLSTQSDPMERPFRAASFTHPPVPASDPLIK